MEASCLCRERRASEALLHVVCPIKDLESANMDDPTHFEVRDEETLPINGIGAASDDANGGALTKAAKPSADQIPKAAAKPAPPPPKKVLPSFKIPKKGGGGDVYEVKGGRDRSPERERGGDQETAILDLTPNSKSLKQYESCRCASLPRITPDDDVSCLMSDSPPRIAPAAGARRVHLEANSMRRENLTVSPQARGRHIGRVGDNGSRDG